METFFERMKWLIDEVGNGRPHTFGRKAMIPKGTMQKYINDRIPAPEHLVSIRETFGVNLNWLLTGKGDPFVNDAIPKKEASASDEDISLRAVQLLTNILASKNEIYVNAMMGNLAAFNDAVRSGHGGKAETPQGMVLIEDRRKSGERRKNPNPDWPVEKELRQGDDRRKAGLG